MKHYQVVIDLTTKQHPKDILWFIKRKLKDVLPVLSVDMKEVVDRPTNDEHHGGYQKDSDDVVMEAYKQIPERY
tara:strand:- start:129 stop:350 length:222 start_codon:yes stop_codon:yes gene_type:complete